MGIDLDGDTLGWHKDLKHNQQEGFNEINPVWSQRAALKRSTQCSTHPEDSDGGRGGQRSETGVVPSEETCSSWVKGWCSKNFETSSKLETERSDEE